jgi:hypothetical protein
MEDAGIEPRTVRRSGNDVLFIVFYEGEAGAAGSSSLTRGGAPAPGRGVRLHTQRENSHVVFEE